MAARACGCGIAEVQLKGLRGTRWMWYSEYVPITSNLPDIRTDAGAASPDGGSGARLRLAGSSPSRDLLLGIRYRSDHSRRRGGRRQLPLALAPAPGWLWSARSRVRCPRSRRITARAMRPGFAAYHPEKRHRGRYAYTHSLFNERSVVKWKERSAVKWKRQQRRSTSMF